MEASSTSGQTINVNGIELYFETRGEGEPLVLLHGGGGVGANWRLIFGETPAGFRLIVPDMRGHGRSTNPSGEFTFRRCALDVFALLEHLGVERFKAVGVSLGAKTLLHMATAQPARADALVLVSAAPYFPAETRALMARFSAAELTEAEWRQMREWHKHGDERTRT